MATRLQKFKGCEIRSGAPRTGIYRIWEPDYRSIASFPGFTRALVLRPIRNAQSRVPVWVRDYRDKADRNRESWYQKVFPGIGACYHDSQVHESRKRTGRE